MSLSLIFLNVTCQIQEKAMSHVTTLSPLCVTNHKAIKVERAVGCPGGLHYPCSYLRAAKVGMQGRALPPPCPPPPPLGCLYFLPEAKKEMAASFKRFARGAVRHSYNDHKHHKEEQASRTCTKRHQTAALTINLESLLLPNSGSDPGGEGCVCQGGGGVLFKKNSLRLLLTCTFFQEIYDYDIV